MKMQDAHLVDANKLVGANIQKYRKAQGLSQEDLAEKISTKNRHGRPLSRRGISNIECGVYNPKLNVLSEIAYELRIPLSYLFEGAQFEQADTLYTKLKKEYDYLQKKHDTLLKEMTEVILRNG